MSDPPEDALHSMTQQYYSPEQEGARLRTARVFVVNGPMSGTHFELGKGSASIGRRPENQICLPLQRISKKHCSIERDATGGFVLRDERSTNGTEVNGRRLESGGRAMLVHGDKIQLCDTVLLFVNPRGSAEAAEVGEIAIDRGSVAREIDHVLSAFGALSRLNRRPRA